MYFKARSGESEVYDMRTMKAAVFEGIENMAVREVPVPTVTMVSSDLYSLLTFSLCEIVCSILVKSSRIVLSL